MSRRLDPPAELQAADLAAAWQRGERPRAEAYFADHPELLASSESAIRLIYEEVCQRQELGEEVTPEELLQRFPRWADELAVILDCHRLVQARLSTPRFPDAGESLGDFELIAELGRGFGSRVFLASQPTLADRPVVLKVTPRQDREFLSLARLQHTHVIPLHGVHEFADRNLRALCMPYLGGATLARLLELMHAVPVAERTGQTVVDALAQARGDSPLPLTTRGGPRAALARASYVEAVCWLGACLADALHYAHERELIHLDIKPSNVLLAADGQPLLLDFHLARHPFAAGRHAPDGFGGTLAFMSPEQRAAYLAGADQQPVPTAVDGRSDLYSLGKLLFLALADREPTPGADDLRRLNPAVSVGLDDVVRRCLAVDADDRYPDAASLAGDLRRHLADQPLAGVRNRSCLERWTKWRRRRPAALLWLSLAAALVAVPAVLVERWTVAPPERHDTPEPPSPRTEQARRLMRLGEWAAALDELGAAIDERPQDFWNHVYLGECAYRLNRPADAVQAFGVAVALAPDCADVYHNRALAHVAAGNPTAALRDYDRAIAQRPGLAPAWLNRGILHHTAGRHAEALADVREAVRLGIDPVVGGYNLALVHHALGETAAARQRLDEVLRRQPRHSEALALLRRLDAR